jgi:predicted ATP-dependent protease
VYTGPMDNDASRICELAGQDVSYNFDLDFIAENRNAKALNEFLGQPRAMRALKLGMEIQRRNYNIYLSGDEGSGRHSAIRCIWQSMKTEIQAWDLAFAYNFSKPLSASIIFFPAGCAEAFAHSLDQASRKESLAAVLKALESLESPSLEAHAFLTNLKGYVSRLIEQGRSSLTEAERDIFKLNIVIDATYENQRPLVFEDHPSPSSLFGQVAEGPGMLHMRLRPGSVLDAEGGFLVINAEQLLSVHGLWDDFKSFLLSGTFLVRQADRITVRIQGLRSVPKIILVGNDETYDKLCDGDGQFLRLFQISAEFDFSMPASPENIKGMIAFIESEARASGMLEVSNEAIAMLLRQSSWYAEQQGELTTQLSYVSDLLGEADYWARTQSHKTIGKDDVDRALAERDFAGGITEARINQEIENGEMVISLSGCKTGVVNGLAIMDRGNISFGTPTVISATVAPGSEGIVNIEHEAGLSGEIHDKGLLILEGYLRRQYARNFPLSIYSGICFEQSYAEVDGDSASSAELFALLSAIGEIPVRQDIAVTGSVNQLGIIQPVGGINEKISGFFRICQITGLTGKQGVIIPKQNIRSLVLGNEVVDAIKAGKFHIYPIGTIDEGMEILSSRSCGKRNQKGLFPLDSFNRAIEDKLRKLYEYSKPSS